MQFNTFYGMLKTTRMFHSQDLSDLAEEFATTDPQKTVNPSGRQETDGARHRQTSTRQDVIAAE